MMTVVLTLFVSYILYLFIKLSQQGGELYSLLRQLGCKLKSWIVYHLIDSEACVCACCSAVSDSLQFPWTVYHQAPLSMGVSRQEYWSGLPFPPPGDLPDPMIQLRSLVSPALQADSLPAEPLRKSMLSIDSRIIYIFQLQAL